MKDCIKTLGLNERGRVQRYVSSEVVRLSEPYVPFRDGTLKHSGHTEFDTDAVWSTPYARYMWGGKVWIDPNINASGFLTDEGWKCTKGAQKIPTDRDLNYYNGALRGDHWVERMLQNGGRKKIEHGARDKVRE